MLTHGLKRGGAPVRMKCEVEISAGLNYVRLCSNSHFSHLYHALISSTTVREIFVEIYRIAGNFRGTQCS